VSNRYLVFHGLAVRKHATAAQVASLVGLPENEVAAILEAGVHSQRVIRNDEKFVLAPLALLALGADYSRAFAHLRDDADFMAAYLAFERINVDLKALITKWQTVEVSGVLTANDHSDKEYDARRLDRLGYLHERFEGISRQLTKALPRLIYYAKALEMALERAENGAIEWVSDVRIDSYHTVWFELHEDLLRITGRAREE
jgi:hypothetical protein